MNDLSPVRLVDVFDPNFRAQRAWIELRVGFELPDEIRNVRPMAHYMLVVQIPPADRTKGGIFIPDDQQTSEDLCFPLIIGGHVGLGSNKYEPYWGDLGTVELHEFRQHQADLIGRCFLCGTHAFRELKVDSSDRPMASRFSIVGAYAPWCEFAEFSYQHRGNNQ